MKKLIPVLFAFFIVASCSKDIDELPPATETGANTFGAIVNGSLWAPQDFGALTIGNKLECRRLPTRDIIINARNFSKSPNETEFEIRIKEVTATGTYLFNTDVTHPSNTASYAYYVKRNITPDNEWLTSSQYTGSVTITKIDSVNRFVSGTFQFNAMNLYNDPQPLTVTEGRFDVKWQ